MDMETQISLIVDPIMKRIDNHGIDLRDIKSAIDNKLDKLNQKLDHLNDSHYKENSELRDRITKLETEKNVASRFVAAILGIAGGIGGGWLQKHF